MSLNICGHFILQFIKNKKIVKNSVQTEKYMI